MASAPAPCVRASILLITSPTRLRWSSVSASASAALLRDVTTATRTVEIDGVKVKEGQIIGLHNGKLITANATLNEACLSLLDNIGMDDYELITMFYGEDVSEDEANETAEVIQETYPDHEIEVQFGGQPHYQFIFSIE